ncbi:MAG: hypothetical protein EBV86_17815, partial [Marivivens sp.]|nr:hypothetical protein [Marivivens sp.]
LDDDQFFLGNASNQAVATDFSTAVQAISIDYTDLSVTTNAEGETAALSYDNTTGTFSFTPVAIDDLIGLEDLSVTTGAASGAGALSYDNTTGVFTFNPADADDLITLTDLSVTTAAAAETSALSYNNTTGAFTFTPVETSDLIALDDISVTTVTDAETSALSYNNTTGVFTFTPVDISDLTALDDFSVTTNSAGTAALSYNNTTGVFSYTPPDLSSYLSNVSEDTTPQLGGDLDVNGNSIVSASNGNIVIEPNGTGLTDIYALGEVTEKIRTRTGVTGSITLDPTEGPVDYITTSGDITVTGFDTPIAGASVTMIISSSSHTVAFDETNSTFYGVDSEDPTLTGLDLIHVFCLDDTTDAEVYIVTHVGGYGSI